MTSEVQATRVHAGAQPVSVQAAALALLTAAFWGGNAVAVSFSVDTLPPIAVAGLRFAMAAVFMLFWCRVEGSELRLRPGQVVPCLVAGVGLFVQIALFNVGVWLSNASHASMLINTFVFGVVVIEHFVTKTDRLTPRKIAGLLVASAGVLLVLSSENWAGTQAAGGHDVPTLVGDLILLVSGQTLAVKIIYVKHALKTIEPGKLILWHDLVGVVLFAGCSLAFERVTLSGFTAPAVISLLYQGVLVAGVCFALQALLLRRHSASQISVFSFAAPLFGVALAVLFRGDPITPWLFLSAACVALGILLVNLASRP